MKNPSIWSTDSYSVFTSYIVHMTQSQFHLWFSPIFIILFIRRIHMPVISVDAISIYPSSASPCLQCSSCCSTYLSAYSFKIPLASICLQSPTTVPAKRICLRFPSFYCDLLFTTSSDNNINLLTVFIYTSTISTYITTVSISLLLLSIWVYCIHIFIGTIYLSINPSPSVYSSLTQSPPITLSSYLVCGFLSICIHLSPFLHLSLPSVSTFCPSLPLSKSPPLIHYIFFSTLIISHPLHISPLIPYLLSCISPFLPPHLLTSASIYSLPLFNFSLYHSLSLNRPSLSCFTDSLYLFFFLSPFLLYEHLMSSSGKTFFTANLITLWCK